MFSVLTCSVYSLWRSIGRAWTTYHLAEAGLESVDSDVVLDSLELGRQGDLGLNEGDELLLGNLREQVERVQVLLALTDEGGVCE